MRSNFHYQPSDKLSPGAASLMQQLRRTQQEIQQNKRLYEQKRNQEQNLRLQQQYNSRDNRQNERLKQQFYELTPKEREQRDKDFFSRFSNNNDEQIKKEKYRNELNKQIEHKRHESVEKQRREQLADEIWSNVLKGKGNGDGMNQNRSSSPAYRPEHSRATVEVPSVAESRNTKEQPVRYTKPAKIAEVHVSEEQLKQQRIKQQKKRLYYQQLNRQIEEGKRRKEEEKRIQKQMKIETFEAKFAGYSKSQEKNNKPQQTNNQVQQSRIVTNQGDRAQEQRILKQRYTKGLIDIEQYERSLRLLNVKYGKKQQNEQKRKSQINTNQEYKNQSQRQQKPEIPLPSRKIQSQNASRDPNQSFNNNYNIGTSRHMYSQSLIQQPTEYYPVYPTPRPQPIEQSTPPQPYQLQPLQQTNQSQSPNIDPYQYANILQQNQMELLQRMMQGMKDIIATTLMYDRKKEDVQKIESRQRQYLNTIQTEEYKSIPRQIPFRQLRSPELTKINSPSPRNFMEPSLSLQNIKIAYQSIDESKNFFKKPPKIKGFKKFDYVEKMGGSTLQIPSTSCFVTSGDGFQKLQRSFQKDIIKFKQSQLSQQIQNIKEEKPYFKKKSQPIQMQTATFKSLGIERKQYNPSSKQSIEQQCEEYNIYQPSPIKPKKWKDNNSNKQIASPKKQVQTVAKQRHQQQPPKQNNLHQQYSQGIFGFPTFVVDDITQLRNQLKKQQTQQNPAILQKSTYEVKKPIIIVNEPDEEQEQPVKYNNSPPKPRQIYELEEIEVESKSQLSEFLRPHHSSSRKNIKRQSSSIRGAEDSIDAQSNFQESVPRLSTNIMKLSRNKINQIKKNKEGLLFDFMALSSPNKKEQYKLAYNPYTYEQQITEKIEQPSVYQHNRISYNSNSQQRPSQQQYEQSQTLISKYQQSNLKQQSELNYSKQPSSLTSLQEARKRAKQGRTRDKKESSLITISTLQQLERQIRKKQPQEQSVIKKLKPSPTLLKNPKELLGILDEMVDGDDDEEYPNVFDSYHQN